MLAPKFVGTLIKSLAPDEPSIDVKDRRADPVAAANPCRRHPALLLLQDRNDLLFVEPASLPIVRLLGGRLYQKAVTFQGSTSRGLDIVAPPHRSGFAVSGSVKVDDHRSKAFASTGHNRTGGGWPLGNLRPNGLGQIRGA